MLEKPSIKVAPQDRGRGHEPGDSSGDKAAALLVSMSFTLSAENSKASLRIQSESGAACQIKESRRLFCYQIATTFAFLLEGDDVRMVYRRYFRF